MSAAPAVARHPQREARRTALAALVRSMRPHQWSKNLLLFPGLVFGSRLTNMEAVTRSLAAFACFCLVSSVVYLINDLRDIKKDQVHPTKRHRPIASGTISATAGAVFAAALLVAGMIGAWSLGPEFLTAATVYLALNFGYSFGLKNVVIMDVMIVALGFVLRAVAGALVIGVRPSDWLILCTLSLALLLSVGKRRQELGLLLHDLEAHRDVLTKYSVGLVDVLLAMLAAVTIMTYSTYTVSEHSTELFGGSRLIFTVPMVFYGVARYLYLAIRSREGGDPASLLFTDRHMLWNAVAWVAVVCVVIYVRPS